MTGRPRNKPSELKFPVHLTKVALDELDAAIRNPARRIALIGEDPNPFRFIDDSELPRLRRQAIDKLIMDNFSFAAQHPTEIRVLAPCAGDAAMFEEATDWLAAEKKRLENEAPEPVRAAIEANRRIMNAFWQRERHRREKIANQHMLKKHEAERETETS